MAHEELLQSDAYVYLAVAGAGAGAQNQMWRVPGASSFFAGASFPYSEREVARFIGFDPSRFVTEDTAVNMAIASFVRAQQSCPRGKIAIGIGVTASVASLTPHRGEHRAWACAISANGRVARIRIGLPKGGPEQRVEDGETVDRVVFAVLNEVMTRAPHENDQDCVYGRIRDRPLFRASGKRNKEPFGHIEVFPGAFNPLHPGHLDHATPGKTIFQITTRTPHKPAVTPVEALKRAAPILARGFDVLLDEDCATFLVKARRWPGTTFIVGNDTLGRILDPKYGHEVEPMFEEFWKLQTKFIVAMRDDGELTLAQLRAMVEPRFQDMFDWRKPGPNSGLSSTKIREGASVPQTSWPVL